MSFNDKFANIYIGNGLKAKVGQYNIPALPKMQSEYQGDALIEGVDPSVEEEKAFEDMLKKQDGEEGEEEGEKQEEDGEEESAEEE